MNKIKKSDKDVLNQGQVSQVHNEHKSQLELVITAKTFKVPTNLRGTNPDPGHLGLLVNSCPDAIRRRIRVD
jgi:hypothetical protein